MANRAIHTRDLVLAFSFALLAICGAYFAEQFARERAWERAEQSLCTQARLVEDGLASGLGVVEAGELQRRAQELGQATGTRITLVRADGSVVADSDTNPAHMDNLASRPELVAALAQPFGLCRRWSPTMQVNSLFVARAIRRGTEHVGWIRVSVVAETAAEHIGLREWALVGSGAVCAVGALLFAVRAMRAERGRSD